MTAKQVVPKNCLSATEDSCNIFFILSICILGAVRTFFFPEIFQMPKRNFLKYLFHRPARRRRTLPVKVYEEVASCYFRCADWVACPDAAWFFAFDGNSGSQFLVLSTLFAHQQYCNRESRIQEFD